MGLSLAGCGNSNTSGDSAAKADSSSVKTIKRVAQSDPNWEEKTLNDGYKLDESSYIPITAQETYNKLASKKGKFVIYIGRPTCPYCHLFRETSDPVLKKMGSKLLYFNTDTARTGSAAVAAQKVFDALSITGVPNILVIQDGVIKNGIDNPSEMTAKEMKEWYTMNLIGSDNTTDVKAAK